MKFPCSKKEQSKKEIKQPVYLPRRQPEIGSIRYMVPSWDMNRENKRAYRQATIVALKCRYFEKHPVDQMIVRQLLAKDLGLSLWRTPPQNLGEQTIWINHELEAGQFIVITGITQLSLNPKVSNLKIKMGPSGATTLGLHDLTILYGIVPIIKKLTTLPKDDELFTRFGRLEEIRMEGYFSAPFLFDEYNVVHIIVESPEGNKSGDRLMLNGFVVEPKGMNII